MEGKWNFDSDNRQKWNGTPTISPALYFTHDQIDLDVIALVKAEFQDHIGQIDPSTGQLHVNRHFKPLIILSNIN